MQIQFETPDQADVRELVNELDAYLYSLYPIENVYALDIKSLLAPNVLFAVVRDAAGVSVGCGAIVMEPGYAEVKRIYVRPEARGKGLARQLVEVLEQKGLEHGCRTFMLETGPAQPEALALYERLGYIPRGPFGDYPDDPLSVFMEKNAGSGMNISIRDYAPSDRDRVNQVALAAFDQYEQHYDDWAAFREGIAQMADLANNADLIVADSEGVVGAVVHVGPGKPRNQIFPDDWSIIRMLVVDPRHRRQGTGKRLVEAALQRAQHAGAPVVGLHTSPTMSNALSLYLNLGFKHDCELPPIRGVPYARYVLPRTAIPAALDLLSKR